MKYKFLITSAGLGSRLGEESRKINKALITIVDRPCIDYIVSKVPIEIEIVVAVGYQKETLTDYLRIAYPTRRITVVEIDKFSGDGSGLGYTLLRCKEYLQLPFIFCSNDTIVLEDIPAPEFNWMGFDERSNSDDYRGLIIDNGLVQDVCAKGVSSKSKPYIGLAGIHDYKQFWESLATGISQGSLEVGESYALKHMISLGIKACRFTWYDSGSKAALENCRNNFKARAKYNILPKANEAIWFVGDLVIKYNSDANFIKNRIIRTESLKEFVPRIVAFGQNLYAYNIVEGRVFSEAPTANKFARLLKYLEEFWQPIELDCNQKQMFVDTCLAFYKHKTITRIQEYLKRFELQDKSSTINGDLIPPISELLNQIDWEILSKGLAVRFHGDLHFENILETVESKSGGFILLDWRQDFGGNVVYGDIYYDLGKLLHGLIVSHKIIEENRFRINETVDVVDYDLNRFNTLVEFEDQLKEFVCARGLSWKKVRLICAIILINIAPLHHHPYSGLLYNHGKRCLWRELKKNG
jgi:hypothetical protein